MPHRGDVSRVADQVEGHGLFQAGARVGYAVNGVLHLLIAWLALQVAWSASPRSADESGALQTVAGNSMGQLALWVAVIGFAALALWQLASAVAVRTGGSAQSSQWAEKAKGIAKAIVYGALAWTCFGFAKGKPKSSKAESADFTATLLQQTGGRVLVLVVGVGIIAVGIYHVWKGWTRRFLQDLKGSPGTLVIRAGMVGYVAQGIALGVVGVLFVLVAVQDASSEATGLDAALRSLNQQAYGKWLLSAVGLGIGAFGVYLLARARYARV
jgi:hypothetical protein